MLTSCVTSLVPIIFGCLLMKYPLVAARTVAATPPRGLHHLRCCVSDGFSLYRQGPLSPIILGMDWIKQNRCRICTDTGMVYLDDPSFYDNELVVDCAQVPTFFTHSKLDPAPSSHDYILVCSTDTMVASVLDRRTVRASSKSLQASK